MLKNFKDSTFKTVSRIIGIFARIGSVFAWIGVVFMVLGASAMAYTAHNIVINPETQEMSAFGISTNYKIEAQTIKFDNGFSITLDEKAANDIKNYISNDLQHDLSFGSIVVLVGAVAVVFSAVCLNNVANLFKSIAEEKTPFTEENLEYVDKIFIYEIVIFVLGCVIDIMASAFFKHSLNIHVSSGTFSTIIPVFIGAYLFKRGYELESKSKAKATKE